MPTNGLNTISFTIEVAGHEEAKLPDGAMQMLTSAAMLGARIMFAYAQIEHRLNRVPRSKWHTLNLARVRIMEAHVFDPASVDRLEEAIAAMCECTLAPADDEQDEEVTDAPG